MKGALLDYLAIAVGGGLGSLARHSVNAHWAADAGIPYATLLVNVVGAFVLGYTSRGLTGDARILLLANVGFLGSFTTFSTLAYEIAVGVSGSSQPLGAPYALATLMIGIAAAGLGVFLAERK